MQLARNYMRFYLDGRDDSEDFDPDLDIAELAEQAVKSSDSPNAVIRVAANDAAKPLEHGPDRRKWIKRHGKEIAESGGDESLAYRHYLQGMVDELVLEIEPDVVEEMRRALPDGDDDDDDEDDGDDEDGEDDDDKSDDTKPKEK